LNNAANLGGPTENDGGQTAVSTAGNYRTVIRVAINHASVILRCAISVVCLNYKVR